MYDFLNLLFFKHDLQVYHHFNNIRFEINLQAIHLVMYVLLSAALQ